MVEMKASEVRIKWKEVLDKAITGEKIYIERAGVQFVLMATQNTPLEFTTEPDFVKTNERGEKVIEIVSRYEAGREPEIIMVDGKEIDQPIFHPEKLGADAPLEATIKKLQDKTYEFCKHGNVTGMCKKGCK
jgi:hypothetical protein